MSTLEIIATIIGGLVGIVVIVTALWKMFLWVFNKGVHTMIEEHINNRVESLKNAQKVMSDDLEQNNRRLSRMEQTSKSFQNEFSEYKDDHKQSMKDLTKKIDDIYKILIDNINK